MTNLPDGRIEMFEYNEQGELTNVTQQELVRCKHCRFAKETYDDEGFANPYLICNRKGVFDRTIKDFFCSLGEKRLD